MTPLENQERLKELGEDKFVTMDTIIKTATDLEFGLDDIVEIRNDAEKGGKNNGE